MKTTLSIFIKESEHPDGSPNYSITFTAEEGTNMSSREVMFRWLHSFADAGFTCLGKNIVPWHGVEIITISDSEC